MFLLLILALFLFHCCLVPFLSLLQYFLVIALFFSYSSLVRPCLCFTPSLFLPCFFHAIFSFFPYFCFAVSWFLSYFFLIFPWFFFCLQLSIIFSLLSIFLFHSRHTFCHNYLLEQHGPTQIDRFSFKCHIGMIR